MIKRMLILASMAVAMLACQEKEKETETDFEKGKKDGKACCACIESVATEDQQSLCLLQNIDLNKIREMSLSTPPQLSDYAAGLLTAPCMLELIMRMSGEYSESDDATGFLPDE